MAQIKINDTNYYYELHGEGEPLVLVAGRGADHNTWVPLLDTLSKQHQVLIFDNRGVGQTQDDSQDLSIELMAKETVQLWQELGLDKPHVLGHSMGGNIAQAIAGLFPDQINKLILSATSPKWRLAMLMMSTANTELLLSDLPVEQKLDLRIPIYFGQHFLSSPKNIAALKAGFSANPYPQSYQDQKRQLEAIKLFNGEQHLINITAKTLVLNGKEDIVSLPEESKFLAEHIVGAHLASIPCGHILHIEQTQTFLTHVLDFLSS